MSTLRIPAMINAHSHAFQIGLRGVGERVADGDDFWSWRQAMYRLAGELSPASMYAVGRRVYGEMAAAGYGTVGEFHYVVHRPDGTPYDDPNAMALALAAAARDCGLEIVLLPAAYHRGGPGQPPTAGQRRFCDPDVATFLARCDALRAWAADVEGVSVGVAVHSVRAVPSEWIAEVVAYSEEHDLVRHVHASEQRRELAECAAEHGCSPIALLARCGFLGERASVVHAIHVSDDDVALLTRSGTTVVTCPTTEGNLGDGHLPALAYRDAGVPLAIGTDEQVRIDPFEELREMETSARRVGQTRDALLAAAPRGDLWGTVVAAGRRSLGLPPGTSSGPSIEIDLDHPSLAGVPPEDVRRALATCCSAAVVVR
ncbi:MAG TPA: formimidoylglutamate deiminase [Solirubrobacteraceae bacterium]|nr:formimidoylglutamate deiminase [Solirubrobacteraceae bacterium]